MIEHFLLYLLPFFFSSNVCVRNSNKFDFIDKLKNLISFLKITKRKEKNDKDALIGLKLIFNANKNRCCLQFGEI